MENKIEIDIYANDQKQGENKFIDIENQNMNYFHIFLTKIFRNLKKQVFRLMKILKILKF